MHMKRIDKAINKVFCEKIAPAQNLKIFVIFP